MMHAISHPAQPATPAADLSAPSALGPSGSVSARAFVPPAECMSALRTVAARHARDTGAGAPDRVLDGGARAALGAACRVARESGLHGEHILLALKDIWRVLPEARQLARHEADPALARLVSTCIVAFYAPASASPLAPEPSSAPD
jgi:hypothetical protein